MPTLDFQFDFAHERVPHPEPLSNTERQLLRELAAPGLPLWKVMRQLADYRESLKASAINPEIDLEDPAERRAVQKVQFTIASINNVINLLEGALTMETEAHGN